VETDATAYRLLGTILLHPAMAALAVQTVGERYWLSPWPSSETLAIARRIQQYTQRGELPALHYLRDDLAEQPALLALLEDLPRHAEAENLVPQTARRLKSVALRLGARLTADSLALQFADPAADPVLLSSQAIVQLAEYASAGAHYPSPREMGETLVADYDAMHSGARPDGFKLYHPVLDHLLGGGLPYGEMLVLGARPSHGKTSFLGNIIVRALRANHPVVFFSLDDSHKLALSRLACIHGGISLSHALHGALRPATEARYKAALRWLGQAPLEIVPNRDLSPLQSRAILQSAMLTRFPGRKPLAALDYAQKQAPYVDGHERLDTRNQVSACMWTWKTTIGDLGVPGIVLAQINRDAKKSGATRPRLENLKESGAIEEDAYAVGLLDYPYRDDPAKPANLVHLYLDKNKGGPVGQARLHFSGHDLRYTPWDDERDTELTGPQMQEAQRHLLADQTTAPPEEDRI